MIPTISMTFRVEDHHMNHANFIGDHPLAIAVKEKLSGGIKFNEDSYTINYIHNNENQTYIGKYTKFLQTVIRKCQDRTFNWGFDFNLEVPIPSVKLEKLPYRKEFHRVTVTQDHIDNGDSSNYYNAIALALRDHYLGDIECDTGGYRVCWETYKDNGFWPREARAVPEKLSKLFRSESIEPFTFRMCLPSFMLRNRQHDPRSWIMSTEIDTKWITMEVTEKHIRDGIPDSQSKNPVALALAEKLHGKIACGCDPNANTQVTKTFELRSDKLGICNGHLPPIAVEKLRHYINGDYMSPFKFQIRVSNVFVRKSSRRYDMVRETYEDEAPATIAAEPSSPKEPSPSIAAEPVKTGRVPIPGHPEFTLSSDAEVYSVDPDTGKGWISSDCTPRLAWVRLDIRKMVLINEYGEGDLRRPEGVYSGNLGQPPGALPSDEYEFIRLTYKEGKSFDGQEYCAFQGIVKPLSLIKSNERLRPCVLDRVKFEYHGWMLFQDNKPADNKFYMNLPLLALFSNVSKYEIRRADLRMTPGKHTMMSYDAFQSSFQLEDRDIYNENHIKQPSVTVSFPKV